MTVKLPSAPMVKVEPPLEGFVRPIEAPRAVSSLAMRSSSLDARLMTLESPLMSARREAWTRTAVTPDSSACFFWNFCVKGSSASAVRVDGEGPVNAASEG